MEKILSEPKPIQIVFYREQNLVCHFVIVSGRLSEVKIDILYLGKYFVIDYGRGRSQSVMDRVANVAIVLGASGGDIESGKGFSNS